MKLEHDSIVYYKLLPYCIPSAYFLIMSYVVGTNHLIGNYGVETDFYNAYLIQAREILRGNFIIDQFRGPMYQIVLAFFKFISGMDFFVAGKILNVISASISLLFIFKLMELLLDKANAFVATLLLSVNQIFWRYTYEVGTDMLFLLLYISTIYFVLRNSRINSPDLLIAGVLCSLAYLTRYTGISLIAFALVVFIMKRREQNGKKTEVKTIQMMKPVLFFFIPIIISIAIWGIICFRNTGQFFYNDNFLNTAYTVYKPADVSKDEWNDKNQNRFSSMIDVVTSNPTLFIKRMSSNSLTYFLKDITRLFPRYIGVLVLIGLVALVFSFFKNVKVEKIYYSISSLLFYLQVLLIFYAERFSIPLIPFYCFVATNLLTFKFLSRFNIKILNLRIFGIIFFILIGLNFISSILITKKEINNGPNEILRIKEFLEKNNQLPVGKIVMSRKPHIAYTLNMIYAGMPFAKNYDEFRQNVEKSLVDYVFVSENEGTVSEIEELRMKLLNPDIPPAEFEIVTQTNNPLTVLYKVKK